MKIRINSIDYSGSIVDGPGVRTVLFLQGCHRKCEECHNPSTWDDKCGKLTDINELVQELKNKCLNRKITISGGEPLLQCDEVLVLIQKLSDFEIVLYTGYELDDIPKDILTILDYIKVGPYLKDKRTTITPYIGSTNQKFIKLHPIREKY
jgi:anaerobic ribonucleoside-triphosphate reductase activating protein